MTVVAAIITRTATAHATDSLITEEQHDGTVEAQEWEKAKVVRVDAFRGAMAYWRPGYRENERVVNLAVVGANGRSSGTER
jgi:hypothetical protein